METAMKTRQTKRFDIATLIHVIEASEVYNRVGGCTFCKTYSYKNGGYLYACSGCPISYVNNGFNVSCCSLLRKRYWKDIALAELNRRLKRGQAYINSQGVNTIVLMCIDGVL